MTAVKHIWNRREMKWQEPDAETGGFKECTSVEEVDSRLVYDLVDKNGRVAKGVEGNELTMAAKGGKWPAGPDSSKMRVSTSNNLFTA